MSRHISNHGGDFIPAPVGCHDAVCVDVVDLGWVLTDDGEKARIRLVWQINKAMEDGKPFMVIKTYNVPKRGVSAPNSNLGQDLRDWRGRPFTDDEAAKFDIDAVIGVPCQVVVIHNPWEGKIYANVKSVLPANKETRMVASGDYKRVHERDGYKAPARSAFDWSHISKTTPAVNVAEADDIPF